MQLLNSIITCLVCTTLPPLFPIACHLQTLYNVSGNAPMLGIVVAMETFCGQAFGARKYATVGIVLQVLKNLLFAPRVSPSFNVIAQLVSSSIYHSWMSDASLVV